EQANIIGDSAKEKAYNMIEEWVMILPKLEACGMEITSFGTSVSISPTLEVELKGKHEDFSKERLAELIEEHRVSTPLRLVFNTIKTTYNLHHKSGSSIEEPLIVKIKVGISPEINVFIGLPLIF
ncbi:MAG: hypothetical protein P1U70_25800, partial [Saprospiraceae bacterium]|nr:hypothetical protein [Saprospiraceae bacterium]